MLLRRPSVFALAIPLFLFAATATAQSNYTIKRLTCAGLGHGVAWDIDNNGNVVGEMLRGRVLLEAVPEVGTIQSESNGEGHGGHVVGPHCLLNGEKGVVHLPEAPLETGAHGRLREEAGVGVKRSS